MVDWILAAAGRIVGDSFVYNGEVGVWSRVASFDIADGGRDSVGSVASGVRTSVEGSGSWSCTVESLVRR